MKGSFCVFYSNKKKGNYDILTTLHNIQFTKEKSVMSTEGANIFNEEKDKTTEDLL